MGKQKVDEMVIEMAWYLASAKADSSVDQWDFELVLEKVETSGAE